MLFKSQFHAGIRSGTVTVAYRLWSRPMAKVGARHTVPPIGVIEITDVDAVPLADVREVEARAAGYASLDTLMRELARFAKEPPTGTTSIYRVGFRYVGEMPSARETTAPADLDALIAKLDRMDERSADGPWTRLVLRLIADRPGVAAAHLAALAQVERLPFKALVRRLKALGLTNSLPLGYELTATGARVLARLEPDDRKARR